MEKLTPLEMLDAIGARLLKAIPPRTNILTHPISITRWNADAECFEIEPIAPEDFYIRPTEEDHSKWLAEMDARDIKVAITDVIAEAINDLPPLSQEEQDRLIYGGK